MAGGAGGLAGQAERRVRRVVLRDAKKCVVCEDAIVGDVVLQHAEGKVCMHEMCEACARPGAFCPRCMKNIEAVQVDGAQPDEQEEEEECIVLGCRGVEMVAFPCDPQTTRICKGCLRKASATTKLCVRCHKDDCWPPPTQPPT